MGVIASQYLRGAKAAVEPTTLSGIAIVTTATAWPNPEIKESVSIEQRVVSATETIQATCEVTVL